jgi:hypothetical protein
MTVSFRTIRDDIMRVQGVQQFLGASVLLLVGLVLTVPPVQAQSNGEGTIYSRFGLGTLTEFSSSQSQAMGGGGFALRTLNYNPDGNPALWSDQVFTRLSGGASVQSVLASDGSGNSGRLLSGNVQAVQFNFPLYERRLGFGLSFQPYSQSNYSAVQRGRADVGPQQDAEAAYRVNFEGSGGLHRLRGGLGYRINEMLRVGATADLIFGVIESQRRTTWENAQSLRNVLVSDGVQLSGLTSTIGGHLALDNVFADNDAFSVGTAVTLPASLSGDRFRTLDEDLARDTLSSRRGDVTLPLQARLGVSYQPNPTWTFVADGSFAPWSTASSDFSGGGPADTSPAPFPIGGTATLADRWRLSTGAEVVPAGDDQLAGYFAQVAYRFGGYVEHMYVRPDQQTDLYESAVTAGVSLPTSLSGTRIDLNTRVGTRGTTSNSLVRDTFFGVSLHVNFGERWFTRRKLR